MTENKAIFDARLNEPELRRLIYYNPLANMCYRVALIDPEVTVDGLWRSIAIALGAAREDRLPDLPP